MSPSLDRPADCPARTACRRWPAAVVLAVACVAAADTGQSAPPRVDPGCKVPSIPPEDVHARALLCNALEYLRPESRTIDPRSGYPFEGWNDEPSRKLFLRSFTQLTAIGQWLELLGDVVAGQVETPALSKDQAVARLAKAVDSLRADQADPAISAKGLLGNFFDLAAEKRMLPMASAVDKHQLVEAFGREKAEGLWRALAAKGWIEPRESGGGADIRRSPTYGAGHFDGPMAPYADEPTRTKLLGILDRRGPLIAFGDNANLTLSVAKTIGALASVTGDARLPAIRQKLEGFLAAQQPGYEFLYDKQVGLFYFGWDTGQERYFGWEDVGGRWQVGHMDYLVNEFRGPATFVVLRYGLPAEALANLGFHLRPYRLSDGTTRHVLAPWEGSAFQGLGFTLSQAELDSPSWRWLLESFVDVAIDYSRRHDLPGFLSESYTGVGVTYSGRAGIPGIAVDPLPRITDAASLYTLGVAHTLAPGKVERFLAERWPVISGLLTEHGPWEGYNVAQRQPIRIQTSAHTFALILGLLGTGPHNSQRYYEAHGLAQRLAELYRPGGPVDLLDGPTEIYAWADTPQGIRSQRQRGSFAVTTRQVKRVGIAVVARSAEGVNLSGGRLRIRYRTDRAIDPLLVSLKPAGQAADAGLIPKQVLTSLAATGEAEGELEIVLPATPGLKRIKEVVFSCEWPEPQEPLGLTLSGFAVAPFGP